MVFIVKSFESSAKIVVPHVFIASKADENGDIWTLDFLKGQNFQDLLKSKSNPGPPLALKADTKRNSEYVRLDFFVIGNAGEKYIPVVLKNNRWQSPPIIEVRDNMGRVIHTGTCKFGGAGLHPYYWQIPNGYRGKLQFELKADFGPFLVRKEPILIEI